MRQLINLTIILTFVSCDISKQKNDNYNKSQDIVAKDNLNNFNHADIFEILNHKKTNDYPSSETDTTICMTWTLTAKHIEQIIKDSELISGPDWHHLFEHLPCSITGQLKQKDRTFEFQINGGSWLTVMNNDTTIYFGYFKPDSDDLFISRPMDIESEE
jgi:hypothetical protein